MSMRVKGPILWFGGKGNMTAKLLPLLPAHHTYVEVFGGGAALLFTKQPVPVEVYNDLDEGLVNFFRVLRDPDGAKELQRLASLTPYSRAEYYYNRDYWQDEADPVQRAYRWWCVARMSFSGCLGRSWSYTRTCTRRGMSGSCSQWLSVIEDLPRFHERIMRVQIECDDFRKVIPRYDTAETLFYCDPPYVTDTRRMGGYAHEMNEQDHKELVELLLGITGKVVVSGYNHDIYNPLVDNGWRQINYKTACYATGRTRGTGVLGEGSGRKMQPRTEMVWLSPNCGKSSNQGLQMI